MHTLYAQYYTLSTRCKKIHFLNTGFQLYFGLTAFASLLLYFPKTSFMMKKLV